MKDSLSPPQSDLQKGNWVDSYLPKAVRPYVRLMRLDRPIGTWLLLLPCWWSLVLASGFLPDGTLALLFAVGALVMRSAGCVLNDLYDQDLDAKVERTKVRPLPSGEVSRFGAFVLLGVLLLIGLFILLHFNVPTIWWGLGSLFLVVFYPLAKRITWWPQLVLGFTFNWGALLGWVAVKGTIGWPAVALYLGGIFWTLGYDTIYAYQDRDDDKKVGVKSLALWLDQKFGTGKALLWIAGFYGAAFVSFLLAGLLAGLGMFFYFGLLGSAVFTGMLLKAWDPQDPLSSLHIFKKNRDVGLLVFLAIWLGYFWI